ncbi:DUF5313 domain-containing protein [Mycolicibacter sp. MYC123]|uniref:DUF5313 domain-containing protein n=1 Tax=[Mycobacterium] zoologicum TaxID=2872311 RepID=A0ABU5YNH8_9MYCO|nr:MULTISPECIES: DUF5313 domain-containing protein [unclassified Mycolicibacter]MEB3051616.1 DUF5313 domain-containing protein [Mycolicibacter sp. MYC123]MEB3064577.1 DUF5313 domain-containing protein [Mycolicibacter sp. MYC101]
MSDTGARRRPNAIQYLRYCIGRPLPASMRDWVRNDLAGPGATIRMIMRGLVPTTLILAPFWLLPTDFMTHLSMTFPIWFMVILFSHALNKVWRKHMLRMHGLDPNLADERVRQRDAHIHRSYVERYGARPESADQRSDDI